MKTKVTRTRAESETAAVVVVYVNDMAPATIVRVEDLSGPGEPMWRARAFRVLREANEYVGEAVADTPEEAERRCRKIAKYKRGVHDVREPARKWDRRTAEAEIKRLQEENERLKPGFSKPLPPAPAEVRGGLLKPGRTPAQNIVNPPPSAPH
jgi:hypothetical protein